ncbi:MAG: Ig-like domain-containing protein [Gemmatimonadetes bacterium]|nr:Ig-like domain-containing protein [Gemmatimonadota bacterium]
MTAVNQLPRIVMLATLAVAHWSCGGGGEPTQPPPPPPDNTVASVSISGGTGVDIAGPLQLTAAAATSSGAGVSTTFSWSSSDNLLATVDASGLVTGVARGSVTITATASGTSISDTHSVTVTVASVSLVPASATLASLGESLNLTAEAKDAGGGVVAGVPIEFTSSDVSVATVSASGVVVAVGDGVATVTASVDGRSAQTGITVAQVATTLSISPAMATLASLGETVNFTATAADALVNAITSGFVWQTGDGSVATVSSTSAVAGVTSVGNGSTTVTVSRDGLGVTSDVVVQQVVVSVVMSPTAVTLLEDFTQQLTADPQDANGNTVAGAPSATWGTSDGSVATVNGSGLVSGVAAGMATITATSDGVQGSAQITVEVVTLTNHVQPIFTNSCALSGCHAGTNPEEGQDLSSGQAFSNVVDVPSNQSALMRVLPFDPDQSYLVHKIEGTQLSVGGSGSLMPLTGSPLSANQIAIIRSWITKGALDN